jgi:hypothetical protein
MSARGEAIWEDLVGMNRTFSTYIRGGGFWPIEWDLLRTAGLGDRQESLNATHKNFHPEGQGRLIKIKARMVMGKI